MLKYSDLCVQHSPRSLYSIVCHHLLSKAPSPRIRIFFNSQIFLSDSKISLSTRSVFKLNSPVHAHPMISGLTLVPRAPLQ